MVVRVAPLPHAVGTFTDDCPSDLVGFTRAADFWINHPRAEVGPVLIASLVGDRAGISVSESKAVTLAV